MVDGERTAPVDSKRAKSRTQKLSFKVKPTQHAPPSQRSSGLETPADASRASSHLRSRYMDMISPRSSNYEHLEGGHGPARLVKRFAWKKFAVVAVAFISLVYLFGPRASRALPWKSKTPEPSA
jgi:guanosine-diphosphatase